MAVGRLTKVMQITLTAKPFIWENHLVRWGLSSKYIFQTVSFGNQSGWPEKNAVLGHLVGWESGRWNAAYFPMLRGLVEIWLAVVTACLLVELMPHGNLSSGVPQHFFPVVPLCACDMQTQAALAEHLALPSTILAQNFQLHTRGT